jgi:hypothetical protein
LSTLGCSLNVACAIFSGSWWHGSRLGRTCLCVFIGISVEAFARLTASTLGFVELVLLFEGFVLIDPTLVRTALAWVCSVQAVEDTEHGKNVRSVVVMS